MTLLFKDQPYAWGDSFYIMDENHQRKYHAVSKIALWNRHWEIRDLDKNVLAVIKKDPKSLAKKKYHILINDRNAATITKEISLLPKYTIENLNWEMQGLMLHNYKMLKDGEEVLSLNEEVTKWGICTVLNITHPSDELLALAVVMTITYALNAPDSETATDYR